MFSSPILSEHHAKLNSDDNLFLHNCASNIDTDHIFPTGASTLFQISASHKTGDAMQVCVLHGD
jgi:hypothetical protein